MKKRRFIHDNDGDESSEEEEDIKALKKELEDLALGSRKFCTGIICQRCRNEGHYVQECQMKQCTNCNSLTHNTSECVYERH